MMNTEIKKESLYRDFYPKVRGYVLSHINQKSEAEDLVSSVFVKVYASLESYDSQKASLSTWIYTITRNTVIDYIKKQKLTFALFENMADCAEKDMSFADGDMLERLSEELERLPQLQRNIVILHYYFELSHKEIAKKVKLSYAGTRKQCSLALAELRRRLK